MDIYFIIEMVSKAFLAQLLLLFAFLCWPGLTSINPLKHWRRPKKSQQNTLLWVYKKTIFKSMGSPRNEPPPPPPHTHTHWDDQLSHSKPSLRHNVTKGHNKDPWVNPHPSSPTLGWSTNSQCNLRHSGKKETIKIHEVTHIPPSHTGTIKKVTTELETQWD
jgi:hypothetical protein